MDDHFKCRGLLTISALIFTETELNLKQYIIPETQYLGAHSILFHSKDKIPTDAVNSGADSETNRIQSAVINASYYTRLWKGLAILETQLSKSVC